MAGEPGNLIRRRAPLLAAPLALLLSASSSLAQSRRQSVESGLLPRVRVAGLERRFRIAERLEHYRVPGAAAAVVSGGRLDWSAGWGVGAAGSETAVDGSTPFQVGGISQAFTALVLLQLAAAGRVDLDAPVNDALRSWKLPVGALNASRPVTARLLLQNTAGIGARALIGYGPSEILPGLGDVLEGSALASTPAVRVERAPGSEYAPSPGGYAILQRLVEDVTERPFTRASEELLERVGIRDGTLEPSPPPALAARVARGHDALGRVVPGGWSTYPVAAAAGLWASAGDLARLVLALQAALVGQPDAVLSRERAREVVGSGEPPEAGLGWRVEGEGRARRLHQSGATDGYRCEVVAWLEGGRGAVVLTNGDGGAALASEILAGIGAAYGWSELVPEPRRVAAVPEAELRRFAGRYELGPHRVLELRVEGAGLRLAQPGSAPISLVPESATRFFSDEPPLDAEFVLDEAGEVLGVRLIVDGRELPARRVP